jgi:hypothetical protein
MVLIGNIFFPRLSVMGERGGFHHTRWGESISHGPKCELSFSARRSPPQSCRFEGRVISSAQMDLRYTETGTFNSYKAEDLVKEFHSPKAVRAVLAKYNA